MFILITAAPSVPLDAGRGSLVSRGLAAPSIIPNTASDVVLVDSGVEGFRSDMWPRPRFVIASEVGETQSRDAVSKRVKMSAA